MQVVLSMSLASTHVVILVLRQVSLETTIATHNLSLAPTIVKEGSLVSTIAAHNLHILIRDIAIPLLVQQLQSVMLVVLHILIRIIAIPNLVVGLVRQLDCDLCLDIPVAHV